MQPESHIQDQKEIEGMKREAQGGRRLDWNLEGGSYYLVWLTGGKPSDLSLPLPHHLHCTVGQDTPLL